MPLRHEGKKNSSSPLKSDSERGNNMLSEACLIPKIKETYHTAKQFAVPGLLQLKVDIASAAAKYMKVVEKVVRPPLMHLRLDVALTNRHFRIGHLAHLFQIVTHGLLAFDKARVHNVGAIFGCYCVGEVHSQFVFGPLALIRCFQGFGCSTVLNT